MAKVEIDNLDLALGGVSEDAAMEAARRWFSRSNEVLTQAGDDLEYETFPVVQSAQPPQWDDNEGAAVMSWPHRASVFFEKGTTAHEVEGDPLLVFEWEAMRGEEFGDTGKTFEEVFDDFPTVFLPRVNVEGIERIAFAQKGRQQAANWLRQQEG